MRHIHPGAPGVGAGLSLVEVRLERDHNRIPHHAGHADRLNPAAGEDLGRVARVSRLHSEGRERIGQNSLNWALFLKALTWMQSPLGPVADQK